MKCDVVVAMRRQNHVMERSNSGCQLLAGRHQPLSLDVVTSPTSATSASLSDILVTKRSSWPRVILHPSPPAQVTQTVTQCLLLLETADVLDCWMRSFGTNGRGLTSWFAWKVAVRNGGTTAPTCWTAGEGVLPCASRRRISGTVNEVRRRSSSSSSFIRPPASTRRRRRRAGGVLAAVTERCVQGREHVVVRVPRRRTAAAADATSTTAGPGTSPLPPPTGTTPVRRPPSTARRSYDASTAATRFSCDTPPPSRDIATTWPMTSPAAVSGPTRTAKFRPCRRGYTAKRERKMSDVSGGPLMAIFFGRPIISRRQTIFTSVEDA